MIHDTIHDEIHNFDILNSQYKLLNDSSNKCLSKAEWSDDEDDDDHNDDNTIINFLEIRWTDVQMDNSIITIQHPVFGHITKQLFHEEFEPFLEQLEGGVDSDTWFDYYYERSCIDTSQCVFRNSTVQNEFYKWAESYNCRMSYDETCNLCPIVREMRQKIQREKVEYGNSLMAFLNWKENEEYRNE